MPCHAFAKWPKTTTEFDMSIKTFPSSKVCLIDIIAHDAKNLFKG